MSDIECDPKSWKGTKKERYKERKIELKKKTENVPMWCAILLFSFVNVNCSRNFVSTKFYWVISFVGR